MKRRGEELTLAGAASRHRGGDRELPAAGRRKRVDQKQVPRCFWLPTSRNNTKKKKSKARGIPGSRERKAAQAGTQGKAKGRVIFFPRKLSPPPKIIIYIFFPPSMAFLGVNPSCI